MDDKPKQRRRAITILLLVLVPLLFLLGWSQASLNLSFIRPTSAAQTLILLAVSAIIFLAFVIFALILMRTLLKLYVERRQKRLGGRFKTKMVAAFLGLSLVPVFFLFIFAYGLLNRSIDKWFGIPFDVVRRDASEIFRQVEAQAEQHALHDTLHLADHADLHGELASGDSKKITAALSRAGGDLALESVLYFDFQGRLVAHVGQPTPDASVIYGLLPGIGNGQLSRVGASARWHAAGSDTFLAAAPVFNAQGQRIGVVVGARQLPTGIKQMAEEIQQEARKYDDLSRGRKVVKLTYLSMLCLLTLLIVFAATWFALFLSKQVTIPIEALAEATHEVSKGNLDYRVAARSDDELGTLIQSFNEMTRQLQENRAAIEQAARDLQNANRELEEHTHKMEAILQNIPTGVISLDRQGQITQVNATAERTFGLERLRAARTLADLLSAEDLREVSRLFRRAARQGSITRQMELEIGGRPVKVALTLSSIRAPHGTVGFLLVLEDLTELLRAQKALAWQEVAQRIAHEIKNPLTPIQLSTERICRLVERAGLANASGDLAEAVAESAALVSREVNSLKKLVDEFSDLARFPASRPVPARLDTIIESALSVFEGRLDGLAVQRDLATDLPLVLADPEQFRRVVINLIDNAAEAVEHSERKIIRVKTSLDAERDVVELSVSDSGPGISPETREKLFLPYFSTKGRGTGLGLAIASRIVAEHNGTIRVEDNEPAGTRFIIELPAERAAAAVAGDS